MFLKFIGHKNVKTNIFRIQANNPIICGWFYVCRQSLIGYTSLFSPYDFSKNDNRILSYFKNE